MIHNFSSFTTKTDKYFDSSILFRNWLHSLPLQVPHCNPDFIETWFIFYFDQHYANSDCAEVVLTIPLSLNPITGQGHVSACDHYKDHKRFLGRMGWTLQT